MTFLRNHDELSLEQVTDAERELLLAAYGAGLRHTAIGGIPRRLAPLLGGDRRKIELLFALLLGLDQPLCLYYGDEIGMGEDPSLPDRHPVRTAMQWDAGPQAGFSTAEEIRVPLIRGPTWGRERVNVARARARPDSLLRRLSRWIARRKESPALRRGRLEVLPAREPEVLALRRVAEGETVLAAYNFSDRPLALELTGELYAASSVGPWEGGLEPYGWCWLRSPAR